MNTSICRIKSFNHSTEQGSVIVAMLMVLLFLSTMLFSLVTLANSNLSRSRDRITLLQAQYSAESGADAAIAVLNSGNTSYTGSGGDVQVLASTQYRATYNVSVANGSTVKERIITAVGKVYSPAASTTPRSTRTVRVVAQRSSTTMATSILGRNIIDVGSGVKKITGKDVFVNGFIIMNK